LTAPHRFYMRKVPRRGLVVIEGDEAHHIASVKRLEAGDEITLFDGVGHEYRAEIVGVERRPTIKVVVDVKEEAKIDRTPAIEIALASAIPKGKRAELIIQKCAELGLNLFIPMHCSRSVVNIMTRAETKMRKWQRISIEASKQCGRNRIMEIARPAEFEEVLELLPRYDLKLIATADERAAPLRRILRSGEGFKSVIYLIGPEGGFTEKELSRAVRAGCKPVLLAPTVLRVETAAIATLAILVYEAL